MAIKVWEKYLSREGSASAESASSEKIFFLQGTNDDNEVHRYIQENGDPNHIGLDLESYDITPIHDDLWEITFHYKGGAEEKKDSQEKKKADKEKDRDGEIQFNTGGATTRLYNSIETIGYWSPDPPAPLFDNAIQVDKDGKPQGTDVVIPTLEWSETHTFPSSRVGYSFMKTLANVTGKVNNSVFRSFAAGEVLFTGASANWNDESIGVTYSFIASPNINPLKIGDNNTAMEKKGHDFVWVYYEDDVDEAAHCKTKKIRAVYIEKIYEEINFDVLGIPNAYDKRMQMISDRNQRLAERRAQRERGELGDIFGDPPPQLGGLD